MSQECIFSEHASIKRRRSFSNLQVKKSKLIARFLFAREFYGMMFGVKILEEKINLRFQIENRKTIIDVSPIQSRLKFLGTII